MKPATHNPMYWVMTTLLVALLPQLATMPPHLVPITLVPLAWRWLAELRGWKPPNYIIRIIITGVACYALVVTYGSLIGRRAAVSLLALMLSLKLIETFKSRDARVVTSLSLFLCATQFLFNQGMSMLFYGVLCLVLAMGALSLLHRRDAFQPTGEAPAAGLGLMSELKFSLRLLVIAAPVAMALFVLFPRWGSPLWGIPEEALDSKTGLSDSMTPGSIQDLFMDDSPAFRAIFHSRVPAQSQLYWRGPVFWDFDGKTWRENYYSSTLAADSKPGPGILPWEYTIQLEPSERNYLFALDYPVNPPHGARLTRDYQLRSRRPVTQLKTYKIFSNPDFIDTPELSSQFLRAGLFLDPEYNPRTQAMMQEWRAETSDEEALVARALRFFNSEEFHYTLNPPLTSEHSVDEFIFNTRRGFCEHYASAFTIMMRWAGIPARVVTGYQGGWYNDIGNYVLVRQSDAHAWSEVWLEGKGWTRVDPTAAVAPSRIERNALDAIGGRRHAFDFAWVRQMRNGIDLLDRLWNDWVIRFDSNLQSGLLTRFGIQDLEARWLVIIMVGVIALLSWLLAPIILRMHATGRRDPAVKAWTLFRKRLLKAGVEVTPAMGPREVAALASAQLESSAQDIAHITELYSQLRYADTNKKVRPLERAVRRFRAA